MALLITGQRWNKMKRWIKAVIISIILVILSFLALTYVASMFMTVKYGTPHYRPKVG